MSTSTHDEQGTPADGTAAQDERATQDAEQHDPDGDPGMVHARQDRGPGRDGVLDDTEPGADPNGDAAEMPTR